MRNIFNFGLAFQMSFKDFSIISSGGHFVQRSETVWEILMINKISTSLKARKVFIPDIIPVQIPSNRDRTLSFLFGLLSTEIKHS